MNKVINITKKNLIGLLLNALLLGCLTTMIVGSIIVKNQVEKAQTELVNKITVFNQLQNEGKAIYQMGK